MKKTAWTSALGLGAILLAASIYLAPYLTLHNLKAAITAHDADRFSENVDYPALRENLKGQLMIRLGDKLRQEKNNPYAAIDGAIVIGLMNTLLDNMISPAGAMAMMQGTKPASPNARAQPATDHPAPRRDYAVSYQGWSTVLVTPRADGDEKPAACFQACRPVELEAVGNRSAAGALTAPHFVEACDIGGAGHAAL